MQVFQDSPVQKAFEYEIVTESLLFDTPNDVSRINERSNKLILSLAQLRGAQPLMLGEVYEHFAHVNLEFLCLPSEHSWREVDVLAAESPQLVPFGHRLEVEDIFPLIARLLAEQLRKLHLCRE